MNNFSFFVEKKITLASTVTAKRLKRKRLWKYREFDLSHTGETSGLPAHPYTPDLHFNQNSMDSI